MGGQLCAASADHKPLIGFRIKVGEWFGHSVISVLDPLFQLPADMNSDDGSVLVLARDGYAVGALTISPGYTVKGERHPRTDSGVNALCITFMKITPKGLDPTASYETRWFGKRVPGAEVKLGGDGSFLYGIYGQKGLNYDRLGLVMAVGPSTNSPDDSTANSGDNNASDAQPSDAQPSVRTTTPLVDNVNNLPNDMQTTQALGLTEGGGPFCAASEDHKPLLGFRIKIGSWADHTAFPVLDPLFDRTATDGDAEGTIVLLARDGYAVGSMTINAGNGVDAFCVRFMKITSNGLDPTDSYVSHWFGRKIGESQTKLGGDGRFVYGIYGRKGLNYDQVGLVMAAPNSNSSAVDDSTH